MRKLRSLFLLLLWPLLSACAGGWPPPVLPSPVELWAAHETAAPGQAFSMTGDISLSVDGRLLAAEYSLLMEAGGEFRLDLFGPFEKRVFSAVCRQGRLLAIAYDQNRAWSGAASPANLAALLGLEATPGQMYQMLRGLPPFWLSREDILSYGRVLASANRGEILLLVEKPGQLRQSISYRLDSLAVLQASLAGDGEAFFEISYRRRQTPGLPLSMEIADHRGRQLSIANDSAGEVPAPGLALPAIPASMELIYLD
jgi:hypothetical protein